MKMAWTTRQQEKILLMPVRSEFLDKLDSDARKALTKRLLDRQGSKCFICDETIDLFLSEGQLDIDHIDPLAKQGLDDENNFALTHALATGPKAPPTCVLLVAWLSLRSCSRRRGNRVRVAPILGTFLHGMVVACTRYA